MEWLSGVPRHCSQFSVISSPIRSFSYTTEGLGPVQANIGWKEGVYGLWPLHIWEHVTCYDLKVSLMVNDTENTLGHQCIDVKLQTLLWFNRTWELLEMVYSNLTRFWDRSVERRGQWSLCSSSSDGWWTPTCVLQRHRDIGLVFFGGGVWSF